MPRFYCPTPLCPDQTLALPAGTARHVQVLRAQPGDEITLFNGEGGEFTATVTAMGRSEVSVQVGEHRAVERELPLAVHLWVVMPANDRMDWLIEKAAELGAASVQPLMSAHSVLRLKADRAEKKREHWQAVAVGASEQCGRNQVMTIAPVLELGAALMALPKVDTSSRRCLLSFRPDSVDLRSALNALPGLRSLCVLNGPEGGLNAQEEAAAVTQGFVPVQLGPRVLRAETAPLAVLAALPTLF
jgi:16S rRNA (uracil1498-N3)-methyltransferase